MRGIDV